MIRLIFPDGTVLDGDHALDVIARLGRLQWEPRDPDAMKELLSDRAWVWSRTAVDPGLPPDEFLDALDAAGLLAVERRPAKATPAEDKKPWTVPDEWLDR